MARRVFVCVLLFAAGCGTEPESPREFSYYADVKPIFDAKCTGCHTEGGIGPFVLRTYEDAANRASLIQAMVADRLMPPWPPEQACSTFKRERSLSDEQIATLTDWVDQGSPEGDPADEPPPIALPDTGLSRVDLTLRIEQPYMPKPTRNDYHCFVLDWPAQTEQYITGIDVRPGNATVVHHVIGFIISPNKVPVVEALDAAEPGPGYTCFGGPGDTTLDVQWMAAWAPGAGGADLPYESGIRVPAGSKIVIQVHYFRDNFDGRPDQTAIDLKVDPAVTREGGYLPLADPNWLVGDGMLIPAGQNGVVHSFEPFIPLAFRIHLVGLHMHTLGRRAELSIQRGSAEECLLDIPFWDFNWQGAYELEQSVLVGPGDRLHLECEWNNTTFQDVRWGDGTEDEMCLGVLYITGP